MAHNLKKFKQMEKEPVSPQPVVAKPKRKKEMNIFGHIAKQFENPEAAKEQRKRALEERKEAVRREKDLKEQEVREKKQKELQEIEERKRRQQEEEERIRIEEEKKRLAEDAEIKRLERQKVREEEELNCKTSRLKPAQERFETCRNLRMRVSKPVTSERIVVNAGAISELRGKLFQNKKSNEIDFQKKTKPPSRKLIIPPNKIEDTKLNEQTEKKVSSCKTTTEQMVSNDDEKKQEKNAAVLSKSNNNLKNDFKEQTTQLEATQTAISHRESKTEERRGSKVSLNKEGSKPAKRQSFISDFASLEKTYKLLGISRDKNPPPVNPTKIRHKSAEKVKTKDKVKKHKSLNIEQELATTVKIETPQLEEKIPMNKPAINILEKGQSANLRNFFQGVISEKKNKAPVELMGPQRIKRGSIQHIFERQTSIPNSTIERQVDRLGVIDKKKFESFLDKFEPQQQREIAKLKVAQITAQQKELEKQKKEAEEIKARKDEQEKILQEEQKIKLQEEALQRIKRNEEEKQKALEIQQISNDENRFEREHNEVPLKPKAKKKKTKKSSKKNVLVQEEDEIKKLPSILASHTYDSMKSKFENNHVHELTPSSSNNVIKVNKLKNNPFLLTLEKSATLEISSGLGNNENINDQPNKLSKDALLKFESKKQQSKNTSENRKGNNKGEKNSQIKSDNKVFEKQVKEVNELETNVNIENMSEGIITDAKGDRNDSLKVTKQENISKKNSTENKLLKRNSTEKKKSFMEDSKKFIRTSAEKLFKLSKEALNEIENKIDERPTIGEMQNYLLSHVLFDGKEIVKKSKEEIDKEDELYNTEYKRDMEKYLALFDDEKPKTKKTKPLPQIKTVEVKSIGEQLKKQFQKPNEKMVIDEDLSLCDKKVNKIRNDLYNKFDTSDQGIKTNKERLDMNVKNRNVDTIISEEKESTVKSKVFDRVQHIMDRFSELEEKQNQTEKKPLEVVSHQSFSNILQKVKTKLETQEETKCESTNQNLIETSNKLSESEWSWKKKDNIIIDEETKNTKSNEMGKKLSKRENQDLKRDELLEDLHSVSNRLKKKEDAEKENERKMKEMDDFMNDIESYLQSPNNSIEEKEFKDDIQEYISIQKSKPKVSKKKSKPKKGNKVLPELNTRKLKDIKMQLLATEEEKSNTVIKKMDVSVSKLRKDLFQKEDIEHIERKENANISRTAISEIKNVFESRDEEVQIPKGSHKIKRTLIKTPETTPDQKLNSKNVSQEWKYKKKSISELQALINKNVTLAPKSVKDTANVVQTNIRRYSCHEGERNEKEEIDDYAHFMKTVNDFLKAPDRNEAECSFKVEIEKYLELIEDSSEKSDEELYDVQFRFGEDILCNKEYTNLMDNFETPLKIFTETQNEKVTEEKIIEYDKEEENNKQTETERKNSLIIERREHQEREFVAFISEVDDLLGNDNINNSASKSDSQTTHKNNLDKKQKKQIGKEKCKKEDKILPQIKLLDLDEIKSKLLTPENVTEEKNTSAENLAVSVSKLKKGLFDVIEQDTIENETKKEVTVINAGIIEKNKSLFEILDDSVSAEPEKHQIVSHDWKYKHKTIQNLKTDDTGETELKEKPKDIDQSDIKKRQHELCDEKYVKSDVTDAVLTNDFLYGDDKTSNPSTEDLSFKATIDPYIQLIENPKPIKKVKKSKKEKKIGKLDVSLLSNLETMTENTNTNSSNNMQQEKVGNFVSEIKKKLLHSENDFIQQKDEDPFLNCVGDSSSIKNKYENLSKENAVKLLRGPKQKLQKDQTIPVENLTHVKTLQELKLERESIKWTWKEKDIKDFEEYIKVHDDIAPLKILERQQHLQDCQEELEVMKSLVSDEHALITQIKEEKDNEFKEFLVEVEDYLQQNTETFEEDEFKKGIKSYLDLINGEDNKMKKETSKSTMDKCLEIGERNLKNEHQIKWKKNSINELHEYINSNKKLAPENISNKLIGSKDHEKLIEKEHEQFMSDIHSFLDKPSISNEQESFKEGIHAYLDLIEDNLCTDNSRTGTPKLPKIAGPQKISNIKKAMIEKSKSTPIIEKKVGKINNIFEIQQQHEKDTKQESKENKDMNILLGSGICSSLQSKFEMKKEEEKKLFKPNKVALVKIPNENRDSPPITEIKEEKIFKWTVGAGGAFPTDGRPMRENISKNIEKETLIKSPTQSPLITPETKKRNILNKYGIKERPLRSESPSDVSDDENTLFNEEELRFRYGLDRFDQPRSPSPEPRQKSNSVTSFHNLLANLRTARAGKVTDSRQRLDSESSLGSPSFSSSPVKSRKVGKLEESRFTLNSETSIESPSPVAGLVAIPGSCSTIKKIFESGKVFEIRKRSVSPESKLIQEESIVKQSPSPQIRCRNKKRSPSPRQIKGKNLIDSNVNKSEEIDKVVAKQNKDDVPRGRSLMSRAKQCLDMKESVAQNVKQIQTFPERSKSVIDFIKPKESLYSQFERSVSIENIERSPSFSTFKDAFEKGNTVKNESEESLDNCGEIQKSRVNAELEALKSNSKIKNMFRINKSKNGEHDTARSVSGAAVLPELDEKTMSDVTKSKSAIRNMFESKGPKMTFGGNKPPDTPPKNIKPTAPKLPPKPHNERKWVFDTINKYFDVIVEDENEESSESEYSSAEEELLPSVEPMKIPASKTWLQQTVPVKKISIDEFIDQSAAEFDNLVVGEDDSENDGDTEEDSEDDRSDNEDDRKGTGFGSHISLNQFQVSRSSSSSKIRSLFHSVLHGSNERDISQFKSNLSNQLKIKHSVENISILNKDPGVYDDSSSEFSEYE